MSSTQPPNLPPPFIHSLAGTAGRLLEKSARWAFRIGSHNPGPLFGVILILVLGIVRMSRDEPRNSPQPAAPEVPANRPPAPAAPSLSGGSPEPTSSPGRRAGRAGGEPQVTWATPTDDAAELQEALIASTPPILEVPKFGGVDTLHLMRIQVKLAPEPFRASEDKPVRVADTPISGPEPRARKSAYVESVGAAFERSDGSMGCGGFCDPTTGMVCCSVTATYGGPPQR